MSENGVREVERLVREQNEWRLCRTLNLIASENVLSLRARALLPSDFTHRYAEGHPGDRYYQGTEYIDVIETRVAEELRALFGCSRAEVRTISGTNANDVVFGALIGRGTPVLVNSLAGGGHISHQLMGGMGKYTDRLLSFPLTDDGWHIDVERSRDLLRRERPSAVVFGKSVILFPEPVRDLLEACRDVGAVVIYDGAHVLGLIAGKAFQDPLAEGADVLLGSTHKTFFGPQRGVVLSNLDDERWTRIDKMAFPGTTSNHHLFTLPPLLVAAFEMKTFGPAYARQVVANARRLAKTFDRLGIEVAGREFGYTDSHQVVVDVRREGGGGKVEVLLKENDIILNRNLLPHDPPKKLKNPSGLRIGVQEMTRWGMKESDIEEVGRLIHACIAEGKVVKEEVHRLRARFQRVRYSFDGAGDLDGPAPDAAPIDVDLAGY